MKFRTLLLGLSALFVAFNAAFFSVTGLSKLFAGASLSVILMASSLELAKLIVAGYLYNYWEKINKLFRIYLIIGTTILVLITSLGIYGFLTAAFQDTLNQYNVSSTQKQFLQQKESFWNSDVTRYDAELERISNNISTLSSAKSQQIQYTDKDGNVRNTVSTAELRAAQSRIATEETNRKEVQSKRQVAADSLQSIQLKILELDTDTETGSELGPLQYLSTLLDRPMTDIINWFILIIIFVFDPLAIALVVAFNNAVKIDKGEKDKKKVIEKRELYGEVSDESTINEDIVETNDKEKQRELLVQMMKEDEKDGLYDDWDNTLQDGLDDEEWDEDHALDMVMNDMVSDLSEEDIKTIIEESLNEEIEPTEELKEAAEKYKEEIKKSEAELREEYNNGGWKHTYDGKPYYHHPWFDWSKKERWINNRQAIDYWISYQGGTRSAVDQYKSKYPDNFDSKTY